MHGITILLNYDGPSKEAKGLLAFPSSQEVNF